MSETSLADLGLRERVERKVSVLVVEDDAALQRMIVDYFQEHGVHTFVASGRQDMLDQLGGTIDANLVILDLRLGPDDGLDLLREIRSRSDIPVIIITGHRRDDIDRVVGLELGADDYLTKPFNLRELLARVRAVLRRPGPRQKFEEFAFGDARIHRRARRVFKAGAELRLTRKEFDLLVYLVEHRGEVVTRDRLLDEVWGYERFPTTRTVDTHVLRLRRKLERDPDRPVWIETVHGHGYKFVAP